MPKFPLSASSAVYNVTTSSSPNINLFIHSSCRAELVLLPLAYFSYGTSTEVIHLFTFSHFAYMKYISENASNSSISN